MKKYLDDLRTELKLRKVNDFDIQDIISDLEEMIQEAMAEGLKEDEIPRKFGFPKDLADDLAKDNKTDSTESKEGKSSSIFKQSDIHSLDIALLDEEITIEETDSDQIETLCESKNLNRYEIFEKDNCLHIHRKKSGLIEFNFFKSSSTEFTIKIPKDRLMESVSIKTKSSDGEISNLHSKIFKMNTVSGDYNFNDCHLDDLDIKAVSGDITLKDCELKQLNVSNVSGDYRLSHSIIDNDLVINTVSGDIDIVECNPKTLRYHSVSGDFSGQEFYPESINVKTVSGDVIIDNKDKSKKINIISKHTISGDIQV